MIGDTDIRGINCSINSPKERTLFLAVLLPLLALNYFRSVLKITARKRKREREREGGRGGGGEGNVWKSWPISKQTLGQSNISLEFWQTLDSLISTKRERKRETPRLLASANQYASLLFHAVNFRFVRSLVPAVKNLRTKKPRPHCSLVRCLYRSVVVNISVVSQSRSHAYQL